MRSEPNPGVDLLTAEDWVAVGTAFELSSRELLVAILIFEGKTRSAIARRLGLSRSTVRIYIDRLYRKLNVKERVGLVLRIVRILLISKFEGRQAVSSEWAEFAH